MADSSGHYFRVTDPNFCSRCGSVLPLPTSSSNTVTCRKCQNTIDISVFHGRETRRSIIFNKKETVEKKSAYQTAGPSVDRVCGNCGHPTMTYKTQQTRSADEGQTVFFSCPECGNQEIEYS